jgi:regulator of protease activity HflC (stomatin/prohibitin superfamily)
VAQFVDQRVRVSDFQAETTLTADTVPGNVDAIWFWMIWDAQKAVLEVDSFEQAVVLSAQTALRNAIGKNELATLLSERDRLGEEIQRVLDEKTSAWGITTQAVEIRDIIIPPALEDAMSRQAQAERERQSRVILGTAETEIAEKYAQASTHYQKNEVALHLRAMNMVYEGLSHRGAMVIVPSSAVETMGLGQLGGLTAFAGADKLIPGDGEAMAPPPPEPAAGPGEAGP